MSSAVPVAMLTCLLALAFPTVGSAFQLLPSTLPRLGRVSCPTFGAASLNRLSSHQRGNGKGVRDKFGIKFAVRMAGDAVANNALYCLHVCLRVKPERRDEFLVTIEANQRGTMTTEPLAVSYLFGEDESTPNTFHLYEAYKSREGFEAHTKAPHFAAWEKFVATESLSAAPEVLCLSLSLTLYKSFSLSLSLSLSLFLSVSRSLSFSLSLSFPPSLPPSFALSLPFSLSHTPSLSHTHIRTHTLSLQSTEQLSAAPQICVIPVSHTHITHSLCTCM